jgi:hypothetical protein
MTLKTFPLKINGKDLLLAYDFNAIAEAEPVAGCNLLAALEDLNNITALQLRGLLYAAVVSVAVDGKNALRLTIQECGDLVRMDTIAPVTDALAEAYKLTLPAPPAKDIPATT